MEKELIENKLPELVYARGNYKLLKWYSRYGVIYSVLKENHPNSVFNCITLIQGIQYIDDRSERNE